VFSIHWMRYQVAIPQLWLLGTTGDWPSRKSKRSRGRTVQS